MRQADPGLAPERGHTRSEPKSAGGGRILVRTLQTREQVESLRDVWEPMLHDSIQSDPDYFLWSLDGEPQVVRPYVLAAERNGLVEAILVARISDAPLPCKLAYRTVYTPVVRAISVVHGGLLGRADSDVANALLDAVFAGIAHGDADALLLRQLRNDSPLRDAALARSTFLTRQHVSRTDLRWQIDLPATFDEYLAALSPATRKGVRRTASHVEKELGERLTLRAFREPDEVDVFLGDAESVAARTYQRSMGVGLHDDDRLRARARMLAAHGWFRSYVLYLDGRPIAFEQGEAYRSRFVSVRAGYDPAYGRLRIGAYLLAKAIEDLVDDPHVAVFDFGLGDAEYKRKLGHRSSEEGDLVVYARRARPIRVNLARTGLLGVSHGVTAGLRRLALLDASKQWWRRRTTAQDRRA